MINTEQPDSLTELEEAFEDYVEEVEDFGEEVENSICDNCSGTGEGMYDGQSCVVCRGKGFLW